MSGRGWGLFALVSVLWGVPYLFNEIALRDLGPVTVAAARVVVAAVVLAPLLLTGQRWRIFQRHWRPLLLVASFEVVIPFTLIAVGQLSVPSGTTGVLIATEPLFIALLAPLITTRPRLNPAGWLGLVLGLAGVATLLGVDVAGAGILLITGAALSYAIGAIVIDDRLGATEPLTATAAMLTTAMLPLVLIAALIEPRPVLTTESLVAVMILGVACTAGGFTAFFALIKHAGATKAALITHAAPVVSLTAGIIVLGEQLTLWQLAGCLLILAGAALVIRPAKPDDRVTSCWLIPDDGVSQQAN